MAQFELRDWGWGRATMVSSVWGHTTMVNSVWNPTIDGSYQPRSGSFESLHSTSVLSTFPASAAD